MAVAEKDLEKVKADLRDAKKRASDLQGDVDRFAVERKSFADIAEANAALQAENASLKDDLSAAQGAARDIEKELGKVEKALASANKQIDAARKIREGLAELG